ncbi:MAG: polyphosphate polymerase domain-containing protein [Treponema sp.]|uniref:polyphosphate polymerase domain-containing protein n=1 Tax=Treponema sp. TaxID=166 RepID=UPI00298D8224|nr:polyphosphate polymerase domain-containing protein [Treponema sp.]MBR5933829.1 polyphosphate polymerase domain-containing protein [Treponema sp.]
MAIEIFNRVELKYILTQDDVDNLIPLLSEKMNSDAYNPDGKTYPVSNVYFDTDSDELIIKSLEKPVYKEKLRLRSYGQVKDKNETVFLEIKKKFDGVVYKRRSLFTLETARQFLKDGTVPDNDMVNRQVLFEIKDLMKRYDLKPKVYISYDRLAFFGKEDDDFRLTLDKNILTRREDLFLDSPVYGNSLLKEGEWLMEAKAFKTFPLWFAQFLSKRKIYNTSFSKYGSEYRNYKQ